MGRNRKVISQEFSDMEVIDTDKSIKHDYKDKTRQREALPEKEVNGQKKVRIWVRKDTLDYANYTVEYKDREQRMIGEFNKKTQYKLLKSPENFKKEFKFYFVEIDVKPKDSTSVGVTK